MKTYILFSLILLSQLIVYGQPAALDYSFDLGKGMQGGVRDMHVGADGKILVSGGFIAYDIFPIRYLARIHPDGQLDRSFIDRNLPVHKCMTVQQDGKILLGGYGPFIVGGSSAKCIVRLNEDGSLDNTINFGTGFNAAATFSPAINEIKVQTDGKIIAAGLFNIYGSTLINNIARINTDGTLDPNFNIGTGPNDAVYTLAIQDDGKILISGKFTSYNGVARNGFARLNQDGTLDLTFNPALSISVSNMGIHNYQFDPDGKIVLVGQFSYDNLGVICRGIVRLMPDGTIDPTFDAGTGVYGAVASSITRQENGQYLVGGSFSEFNGFSAWGLVRLNTDGSIDPIFDAGPVEVNGGISDFHILKDGRIYICGGFTLYNGVVREGLARIRGDKGVSGFVFLDFNQNQVKESNEVGIYKRKVLINPGNYVVETEKDGSWFIDSLPAGNYTLTSAPTDKWVLTTPAVQNFTVTNVEEPVYAPSIGLVSTEPCPSPTLSIVMSIARPCFTGQVIHVKACNDYYATDSLANAYTIVELDTLLIVESASIPFTDLGNGKYRFEIGNTLIINECFAFKIYVQVNCNAITGQTVCMKANLYPIPSCTLDTIPSENPVGVSPCTLPWDKSSLKVEGWCANDSIYFTVNNTGVLGEGDMDCYAPVRLYIDGEFVELDSIRLLGGETIIFAYAATGQTFRLEADQHPLHPGNSHPNASVELCGNIANWKSDLINVLPQDDLEEAVDIYCTTLRRSMDPNDKTGYPLGIGTEHIIRPNGELEYLIRFQNTGTDTAFTVVIRDTLDMDVDIFSVVSGVSSHDYTFRMYGPRVLEWTFRNILLPDSTINEVESHGFVSFRVNQNPDLLDGIQIENTADIYFDFNEPVITNTTNHKVERFRIETTGIKTISSTDLNSIIYPNPTDGLINIRFGKVEQDVNYKLRSLSGQLIMEEKNKIGQLFQLDLSKQAIGIYLLEVKLDGNTQIFKVIKQ